MTIYSDNYPYNIEAPQKLNIQYSHDINFDYSTGRYPSGIESEWHWENQYIPISHKINGLLVGKHEWLRIKIGEPNTWTYPIRVSSEVTNIDTISSDIQDDGVSFTFSIVFTFSDGTTKTSEPITVVNGKDGTEITNANIDINGDLILTYSTGVTINAGRARGEDFTGIVPGPDDYFLSTSSGIYVWVNPLQLVANSISATTPIEYDPLTGKISHNLDDGNKHIPLGGNAGEVLSTDGGGNYTWIPSGTGSGDMLKSTYDPTNIEADAFDYNNFYNTPTIPVLPDPLKPLNYQTLISDVSVDFDNENGLSAILTLGHNVTLNFLNLINGDEGNIEIIQGASNYTLTIIPTPYVIETTLSNITIIDGIGSKTILSYSYNGTTLLISNDIGATGSGTDELVKYDIADPTAGYLSDKIIAGNNITISEGTGADENKLVISSTGGVGTESDPLSLHLDQTTPQSVINGAPVFDSIDFDITPSLNAEIVGRLQWSDAEQTLQFGVEGGTIDVNKEIFDYYTDSSIGGVVQGDVVSVVAISGNRQGVDLTDCTLEPSATACIGMVTNVGTTIRITKKGRVHKLNTDGLIEGLPVYVDYLNPGKYTQVVPVAPCYFIHIGIVEVANTNNGIIDVDIRVQPKFADLSDVNGTPLNATGQFPVWHNDTKVFDFTSNISDFATSGHTHTHNNLDGIEGGDITHKYHSDQQINVSNNVEFNTVKSTALNSTEAERGFDAKFITGIPDAEKKKFKIVTSYAGGNITASVAFVGAYTSFSYYVNNKKFTVTASTIAAYTKTATAAEGTWFFYVDQSTTDVATPVITLSQTSWGLSDPDALLWNFSFDMTNLEFTWVGHEKHTAGRDIFQHARNHAQGAQYSSGFLFSQYNGLTAFSTNTDDNFGRALTQISSGSFFDEDLKNSIVHSDSAISATSPDLAETDWDKFVYQFLGFTALATAGTSATSIVFASPHTLVAGQAVTVMAGNTTTIRGTTTITTGGTGTTFTVASVTGLASGDAIVLGGRIPIYYIHSVAGSTYTWRKFSATDFLGVTTAAATWTRSTTTATVTFNNHGMQTGNKVTITISSDTNCIPLKAYTITRTGVNTFTIPCLNAGGTTGSITYYNAYNSTTIASGVAQYNNAVTGLFTTGTANRHIPFWIMETNFISEPVIAILGQGQSTSATLATSLTEAPFQFSNLVGLSQLGIAEICPTYRLVFYYNTNAGFTNSKIRLVAATFLDVRVATVSGTIVSGGGTSDHALLSNTEWVNSNHTGTINYLAGFGASGEAVYVANPVYYSSFDATVGTGGDYATIYAAYAAGKRFLKIISNITENAVSATDYAITNLTIIGTQKSDGTQYIIDWGDNFLHRVNDALMKYLYVENLAFTHVAADLAHPFLIAQGTVIYNNVAETNIYKSTSLSYVYYLFNAQFNKYTLTLRNARYISQIWGSFYGICNNISIIGAGTGCSCSFDIVGQTTNLNISGTYDNTFADKLISLLGSVNGITSTATLNTAHVYLNNCTANGCSTAIRIFGSSSRIVGFSGALTFYMVNDTSKVTFENCANVNIATGTVRLLVNVKFVNCIFTTLPSSSNIKYTYCTADNCTFAGTTLTVIMKYTRCLFSTLTSINAATTAGSDKYIRFNDCIFSLGIDINTNYAIMQGCEFASTLRNAGNYNKIKNNEVTGLFTNLNGAGYNVIRDNTFTAGMIDNSDQTTNIIENV